MAKKVATADIDHTAELETLSKQANAQLDNAVKSHRKTLDHMRACGAALVKAQKLVRKRQWGKWVKQNFNGSPVLARKYMQLANHWDDEPVVKYREAHPMMASLRAALKAIAEANQEEEQESAEGEESSSSQSRNSQPKNKRGYIKAITTKIKQKCQSLTDEEAERFFDMWENDIWPELEKTWTEKLMNAGSAEAA